jgi:hypothetical protein
MASSTITTTVEIVRIRLGGIEDRYRLTISGHVRRNGGIPDVTAIHIRESDPPGVTVLLGGEQQLAAEALAKEFSRVHEFEPDWWTTKAMVQKLAAPVKAQPGDRAFAVLSQQLWDRAQQIGWKAVSTLFQYAADEVFRRAILGDPEAGHAEAEA